MKRIFGWINRLKYFICFTIAIIVCFIIINELQNLRKEIDTLNKKITYMNYYEIQFDNLMERLDDIESKIDDLKDEDAYTTKLKRPPINKNFMEDL